MRILFQGDSITDCRRSKDIDFRIGMGYALMCQAELTYENPGKYEILNRGISGNKLVDLYARLEEDIIKLKPDVLSILIGVNDVGHGFEQGWKISDEKYFTIYCRLIEEVLAALPDVKIMIMEPFVLKGSLTCEHWDEFKSELLGKAKMAKKVADKYNLTFIPLQEKFDEAEKNGGSDCWMFDGVHPYASGHYLIKNEWIKAFKTLNI